MKISGQLPEIYFQFLKLRRCRVTRAFLFFYPRIEIQGYCLGNFIINPRIEILVYDYGIFFTILGLKSGAIVTGILLYIPGLKSWSMISGNFL